MSLSRWSAFAFAIALPGFWPGPAHAQTADWCAFAVESHAVEVSEAVVEAYDHCLESSTFTDAERGIVIHQRGTVHQQLGDQESAIADFDLALPLVLEKHVTFAVRGSSYLLSERPFPAIQDLSEAIAWAPGIWTYWYLRGIGHEAADNLPAALSDYETAALLEPANAEIMTHMASVRSWLGDYDGAVDDHSVAIGIDPENVTALNGRAWNLILLDRDLEDALVDAQRADVLDPDSFEIADTMAHVLSGLGRRQQAMD
jgi:tetratricopeptide (TPR) repeat protein